MLAIVVTLIIALSAGGVVAVADNARPGDALFGIDRGVENIRLALARKENGDNLRIRFSEERIREVRELKEEDDAEEDEDGENKHERTVEAAVIAKAFLEKVALEIGTSTNASTTVQLQLNALINQFNSQADEIEEFRIDLRKGELRVRIDDDDGDDKERFEVRTDDGRVRVEIKDGEVKIKSKINVNSANNSSTSSSSQNSSIEVEADIFTDITTVKVEINDVKTRFTTNAKTRVDIVKAIVERFPLLTSAQIEAVLELETEDRASRPQDLE